MLKILKNIKYIAIISIFILPTSYVMADSGNFAQTTYNLNPNTTFSLDIMAVDFHDASMVDVTIEYDPTVITYQGFSEGAFTDPNAMFKILTSVSNNNGMERRLFTIPCDLQTDGDGILITASFTASSTPESTNIDMVSLDILHPDFSNTTGTTGSNATVTVLDNVNPNISITSPTSDDTYSLTDANNVLTISGTASDNASVSSVAYSVDTGDSGSAIGTTTWSADVSLVSGDNIITVTATDSSGNTNTDTLTVSYSVPAIPSVSFAQTNYPNLNTGDSFDLIINAQDISDASSIAVTIDYDPTVITYQGFSEGAFTDPNAMFGILISVANNHDMEQIMFTIPCDLQTDGDGILITASFTASSTPGTTNVSIIGLSVLHPDFSATSGNVGTNAVVTVLDNVNPNISITSPTSDDTYSLTDANNVLTISGTASDNASVSSVAYSVDTGDSGSAIGTTTWSADVSLVSGDNIITVTATDSSGNTNTDTLTVSYSVPDTTAPTISAPNPSGELNSGTTETTLSVTTNENAVCHYSATANTAYTNSQVFTHTNSNTHTTTISGLENGKSYNYYVRCRDDSGNTNTSDTKISFGVKSTNTGSHSGGGGSSSKKDKEAPKNISVRINNNETTTEKRSVTLNLTAKDNSTPVRFQASNINDFKETRHTWIKLKNKYTWTLTKGNGNKTVYVRFKDSKNNISTIISDSILLDEKNKTETSPKIKASNISPIVKGVSTFRFTQNIKLGSKNNNVLELQKKLRKEGFFNYPTNTGYFGQVTLRAVRAYQKHYGIDQTGFVGPITRGALNKSTINTTTTSKNGITIKGIINLFLAMGIIPKEKADVALAALALI